MHRLWHILIHVGVVLFRMSASLCLTLFVFALSILPLTVLALSPLALARIFGLVCCWVGSAVAAWGALGHSALGAWHLVSVTRPWSAFPGTLARASVNL